MRLRARFSMIAGAGPAQIIEPSQLLGSFRSAKGGRTLAPGTTIRDVRLNTSHGSERPAPANPPAKGAIETTQPAQQMISCRAVDAARYAIH